MPNISSISRVLTASACLSLVSLEVFRPLFAKNIINDATTSCDSPIACFASNGSTFSRYPEILGCDGNLPTCQSVSEDSFSDSSNFNRGAIGQSDSARVDTIRLRKRLFGSQKFILGDNKPQNVFSGWWINFKPDFQKTLSQHPPALREARRSYPYYSISMGASFAMTWLSLKNFFDTLNKAEKVSEGKFVDTGFKIGDLVLLGVVTGVIIVSSRRGYSHLKKGIQIFNERQQGTPNVRAPIISSRAGVDLENPYRSFSSPNFGIKFGINSAYASGDAVSLAESHTGLAFGAYYSNHITELLGYQVEALYNKRGYKFSTALKYSDFYGDFEFYDELTLDLHYLEIPVLARISIPTRSGFQPYFLVGPSLGFVLSSKQEGLYDDFGEVDLKIKASELAMVFGFSGRIKDSPLTFGFMSTSGLTSVIENKDVKNRVFMLTLGYSIEKLPKP